jgi:hypothetical protein
VVVFFLLHCHRPATITAARRVGKLTNRLDSKKGIHMNNQAIAVSFILGTALVLCTWIASSAVESFGRSIENSANYISSGMTNSAANSHFPSAITLQIQGGEKPLRLSAEK